jgi:hypothetical protein
MTAGAIVEQGLALTAAPAGRVSGTISGPGGPVTDV